MTQESLIILIYMRSRWLNQQEEMKDKKASYNQSELVQLETKHSIEQVDRYLDVN